MLTAVRSKPWVVAFIWAWWVGCGSLLGGVETSQGAPGAGSATEPGHRPGTPAQQVTARTDKQTYTQGENVQLIIKNVSEHEVSIVDRASLDAGVGTIERQEVDGAWRAIELYAAAAASVVKVLKGGEQHVYVWSTVGYNRSDTVAPEGTYRILIGERTYSNSFEIRRP